MYVSNGRGRARGGVTVFLLPAFEGLQFGFIFALDALVHEVVQGLGIEGDRGRSIIAVRTIRNR